MTLLMGESIQPEYGITNELNDHQMRNPLERECVVTAADSVLDSSDVALNLGNMLVLSTEINIYNSRL
jgi:hypothetical protein